MVGWHHQLNGLSLNISRRWRNTGKPDMPQSMGSQRVRQDLVTEQQQKVTGLHLNFVMEI